MPTVESRILWATAAVVLVALLVLGGGLLLRARARNTAQAPAGAVLVMVELQAGPRAA